MSRVKINPQGQLALMEFIVQALPEPALLLSTAGKISICNQAASQMFGYSPVELTGQPVDRILEPGQFAEIPLHRPPAGTATGAISAPPPESCTGRHRQRGTMKLLASGVLVPDTDQVVLFLRSSQGASDPTSRQLQYIIENSEEAIFLIGEDLTITSWNRGASNTYFYSSAESFGKPVHELFPTDQRDQVERLFASVKEGFSINQYECTHLRNGGVAFEASLSITPYFDASGEAKGYSLMVRDISLRRQAERRLQESEERFRQLAENITEVFWLRTPTEMLYISPGYEKVFGRSCVSLYRDPNSFLELIHPDDRERVLAKIFADGEFANDYFDQEYRIIRPDGEIRWVRARSFPVRDNSAVPRSTGIAEDITVRKEIEEALRVSEGNLLRAQQIARLGYWHWDVIKDEITWSDEIYKMFGRDSATFKPDFNSYTQHIHPDDREWSIQRIKTSIERAEPYSITHRIVTVSGRVRYLRAFGEVSRGPDSKPEQMFGIALDITEQTIAEMSLRDSEERFRNVFEQSTLGMALLGLDGRFTRVNQVLCQMMGYTLHEFLDLTIDKIYPSDDALSRLEQIGNLLSGEQDGCMCETQYVRKDGTRVYTEVNATCIRNASGEPQHVVLQVQDISERHETLQLLRRSQETLSQAESLAHLGNWDWDLRTNNVVWSDEAFRIFGFEPNSFTPTSDAVMSFMFDEDADNLRAMVAEALTGRGSFETVFRVTRPNGQVRHVQGNGIVLEENGEPARLIGSILDITERKTMEDQLRFSEERLQLLSDSASEGVVIHEHGLVLNCNNAVERIFRIPIKRIIGHPAVNLIHPEDRHISNERIAKHQAGSYEARGIRADGTEFPMLVTALETTSRGKPVRVVLFQDLTDRKAVEQAQQEAAAREAELQMLKMAAATYAHEINNPLTGIQATLQILQDHPLPEEDTELLNDALSAVHRISEVIESMQRLRDPQYKPYLDREILDIASISEESASN